MIHLSEDRNDRRMLKIRVFSRTELRWVKFWNLIVGVVCFQIPRYGVFEPCSCMSRRSHFRDDRTLQFATKKRLFYFAYKVLTSDHSLPSFDILEAIHAYSTGSYDNATWDRGYDGY